MSEVKNTNVFDENKRFVDITGLRYFWEKTKGYVDGENLTLSGKVSANETAIKGIQDELTTLSGGVGSVGTQINNAIAALDLPNTYEAKGDAAKAETAAKAYADEKNTAMDTRVKVLESIDHSKLATDAAASAVATVLDGAPESFDTLKEVAQWIADSESASSAADLVTRVGALEAINHDAYKAADETVLASAKSYADGKVDGKFDAAGAAATAKSEAVSEAKSYTDTEIGKLSFDAAGSAAAAQAAAIAQAKLDAAEALKAYYTKTEVDNLLSTNSAADQAYAKTYTDQLFSSIQFAQNSEIDALFA